MEGISFVRQGLVGYYSGDVSRRIPSSSRLSLSA